MNFIINNKIKIVLVSEIIAWVLLIPMFYYRHWTPNPVLFWTFMILSGIFGYVPHIGIPVMLCVRKKSLSPLVETKGTMFFMFIVILLFAFGLTEGKDLVHKIDSFMFQTIQNIKKGH